MENKLEELIVYFEQQLNLQRKSEIKYTGEEAYFDAVDVCKNTLKALRQPDVIKSVCGVCVEYKQGSNKDSYCMECGRLVEI